MLAWPLSETSLFPWLASQGSALDLGGPSILCAGLRASVATRHLFSANDGCSLTRFVSVISSQGLKGGRARVT